MEKKYIYVYDISIYLKAYDRYIKISIGLLFLFKKN